MAKKKVVLAIIRNKKGEVLLQKKTFDYNWFPGKWSLFGGSVEKGESFEEAMRRELFEELGLNFNKIKFLGTDYFSLNGVDFEGKIFSCDFKRDIKEISLGEGAGFAFFDKKELDSANISEVNLKILKKYI